MTKFPYEAHFARKPRPWYKRAVGAFLNPQGGIPIARALHREIDCGQFILTFLEPSSAFGEGMGTPDPIFVNLDASAFTIMELGSARAYPKAVDLGLSNWIYQLQRWKLSRLLPVPHPPYAVITAHWRLEYVKHGIQLDPDDVMMLEEYLRHDYISYLESEGGDNWKVRDEAHNGKTLGGDPLPQYRIDDILDNRLRSPPLNYEVVTSNRLRWLRYMWAPRPAMPDTLNYTTTLLPDVLLTASFHIGYMNSEPREDWWSLFMEDCEILVKTIACRRKTLPGTD